LARKDLPAISNWWGAIVLPLLTCFLLYRIQKRILRSNTGKSKIPVNILYRFAAAFLFGILLSAFFTFGYADIPGYMMMGLFILALFFPIYLAECLLGFVIGMTFTFGAVLPTAIGSLLVVISIVLYLYVRPAVLYITSWVMRTVSSNKDKTNSK
jgi:hypothetical protein